MDMKPDKNGEEGPPGGSTPLPDDRQAFPLSDEFRLLHETAPIGYFILGRDTTISGANVSAARTFGKSPAELRASRFTDLIAGPDMDCFRKFLTDVQAGDGWHECEATVIKPDASHVYVLLQGRRLAHAGEVVIFATDITKHRAVEVALKESEQRYKDVADRLAEGVFEADTGGRVTYANQKAMSSLGLDENDLKRGLKVFDVIAPVSLGLAGERFAKVLRQEDVGAGEYILLKKGGSSFPALVHSLAIVREGQVVGVRGIMVDISERKRAEAALEESERKFRELSELLGAGIFEADAAGVLTYANPQGLGMFGLTDKDLKLGFNLFEVVTPRDRDLARANFGRVLRREDVGPLEYLVKKRDGAVFTVLTHSTAIIREGGVAGVRGIVVDISDLKRTEQALKDSERRYRELTDLLDEAVFEMDLSGKFTYANRKGLSSLGIDEHDLERGITVFDIVAPSDLERARENLARALEKGDTGAVEFCIVRKDGTSFPALTHGSAILRDETVMGVRGVVFDISDLKKTEQALRESEQRLGTLLKSLHEGIWVLDKDDRTTYVNPRMAEMLGYTEDEMVGKPVYEFNDEEWRKFTAEKMERRRQGITEQLEGELVRKDGGRVYALFETSPITDDDGKYAGSIAGVQDITERKLSEERMKRTLAELDRSNKELEHFAYVTSHDLREPLRMMTSFAQALERRYKDKLDGTADEYIHFIVDGASRMQRLIDDILVYSRVGTRGLPFEPVDMGRVLQEVLLNLRTAVDEAGARISSGPLPVIHGDPVQMQQVLQNLISNALKFRREEELPAVTVTASRTGPDWLFAVADNGIGVPPELFGRLFVLFQRLHPPDKYPGTGVGLAVTKKIVERHGGRIWVESEPGKGSTFRFTIPAESKAGKDDRE
ncbi:MAG TPA: PAS domain S-box protein [Acidobacteriota bacterium]|nr:PAS domain S-box protein [Acidobacteriota bacterium]